MTQIEIGRLLRAGTTGFVVAAYVAFIHYAEGVLQAAGGPANHAGHPAAAPAHEH